MLRDSSTGSVQRIWRTLALAGHFPASIEVVDVLQTATAVPEFGELVPPHGGRSVRRHASPREN